MPNIASMDNGTMVESFKIFNYYQLATSSLVSKRFGSLICTHRHKLALLDVNEISMNCYTAYQDPAVITMFNKKLSLKEYNEWTIRNGYSEQVPLDGEIARTVNTENDRNIYEFWADVYENPGDCQDIGTHANTLYANTELRNETWPLFQHFIRLLVDPFIFIRTLKLNSKNDTLSLLVGGMNPDRNQLHCEQLKIYFDDDIHKLINWIKDHVRCEEILLDNFSNSNYDEEFLDFFMTGTPYTSLISVVDYDLLKVIVGLVQSIWGDDKRREVVEELKRDCTGFIAKEEQFEEESGTRQVVEFINNDIKKKLTFSVQNYSYEVFIN